MKVLYRQGDVLIEQVGDGETITGDALQPHNGRIILAYGEATGHHHSIAAEDVAMAATDDNGVMFLKLCRDTAVTHQEHETIPLKAGTYRVTRQREYAPEANRNVQD